MTAFTKTINERINLFGAEPSNKWGTVLWGQKWAYGNVGIIQTIYQSLDEAVNIFTLTDAITLKFVKIISESFAMTSALDDINVTDSQGYRYVFTTPTIDGEDAPATTWTSSSEPSTTFTTVSEPTTTWGNA